MSQWMEKEGKERKRKERGIRERCGKGGQEEGVGENGNVAATTIKAFAWIYSL